MSDIAAATNSTSQIPGELPEENQNDRYKWVIWGIVIITIGGFCLNWFCMYIFKFLRTKVDIETYLMECLDKQNFVAKRNDQDALENWMEHIFTSYDVDNDGNIDKQEIKEFLDIIFQESELVVTYTWDDLEDFFHRIDLTEDGFVSKAEMKNYFRKLLVRVAEKLQAEGRDPDEVRDVTTKIPKADEKKNNTPDQVEESSSSESDIENQNVSCSKSPIIQKKEEKEKVQESKSKRKSKAKAKVTEQSSEEWDLGTHGNNESTNINKDSQDEDDRKDKKKKKKDKDRRETNRKDAKKDKEKRESKRHRKDKDEDDKDKKKKKKKDKRGSGDDEWNVQ